MKVDQVRDSVNCRVDEVRYFVKIVDQVRVDQVGCSPYVYITDEAVTFSYWLLLYVVSLFEAIPLLSCDGGTSSSTVKTTAI